MATFRDAKETVWTIEINGATVRRTMRSPLAVDLGEPFGDGPGQPGLLQRMTSVLFLVDLLWVICQPEAEAKGIDEDQFVERLGPDALGGAHAALCEALVDFFQKIGRRDAAAAVKRQRQALDRTVEAMEELMASGELDEKLGRRIESIRAQARKQLLAAEDAPAGPPEQAVPGV